MSSGIPVAFPGRAQRFASAATIAAVAVLGLAACGGNMSSAGSASGGTPAAMSTGLPAAVAHPGLTQGLVLPLETYMETYPEREAIGRAKLKLVQQCMSKFGFTYTLPATSNQPVSNDVSNMGRRYGISDPDEAARYGYHLPDYAASPPPPTPVSSAEEVVLMGHVGIGSGASPAPAAYHGIPIPHDGCLGSSTEQLGATIDASLPQHLDYASLTKAQAEPQVQAALKAWSACMKSKGYTVDIPYDAPTLAGSSNGPAPTSAEIAVAVADVACKQQTNLIKIWFTADSAIQTQEAEQNQLALEQLRKKIDAAVKASAAVTG